MRFTSGTTGTAKGVILTHQSMLERIRAANRGLGLTCEDTVLWVLPMAYHFFVSILLYLEVGAAIVISRRSSGREHSGRGRRGTMPPSFTSRRCTCACWRRGFGTRAAAHAQAGDVRFQPARSAGRAGLSSAIRRAGGAGLWHH